MHAVALLVTTTLTDKLHSVWTRVPSKSPCISTLAVASDHSTAALTFRAHEVFLSVFLYLMHI